MDIIYTIGHSNHTLEYFLSLLAMHNINTVIDIRSIPYSRYVPHFNKERIKQSLKEKGIYFIYMAEEFGIIQPDEFFHPEGYIDFEKVQEGRYFKAGIDRVKVGIQKGYRIALMCAEKDPMECHRSIMVTPVFKNQGYEVYHILDDGRLETQEDFESRLIERYFPEKYQQDFFRVIEGERGRNDLLKDAMRLRNKDIGYRKKDC